LPPCDVVLLKDAAVLYQNALGIPVKFRRLKETWTFGPPERVAHQRDAQQFILQKKGAGTSFEGWTKDRYAVELTEIAAKSGALEKFWINRFIGSLSDENGQHSVDFHVDTLNHIVSRYRSDDRRTMYVGITSADIYSGSANYVFSMGSAPGRPAVSILSYHMMLAKTLGELQSRRRLSERIAKELVPASLGQLNIPRPADPTDPYSYSSGMGRTDQKTLIPSEPTRAALDAFR